MGRMSSAARQDNIKDMHQNMFDALKDGGKAQMAIDILYRRDPGRLAPPDYVKQGLVWLESRLKQGRRA